MNILRHGGLEPFETPVRYMYMHKPIPTKINIVQMINKTTTSDFIWDFRKLPFPSHL